MPPWSALDWPSRWSPSRGGRGGTSRDRCWATIVWSCGSIRSAQVRCRSTWLLGWRMPDRVLAITGGAGRIATGLRPFFRDRYKLRLADVRQPRDVLPDAEEFMQAD